MAVFDPEKHEADKLRFLSALYDMVAEEKAADPDPTREFTLIGRARNFIGDRAGLTREQSDRIGSDLFDEDMIVYRGSGLDGPVCTITKAGREAVERHRFDRTPRGRIRKLRKGIASAVPSGIAWVLRRLGLG